MQFVSIRLFLLPINYNKKSEELNELRLSKSV